MNFGTRLLADDVHEFRPGLDDARLLGIAADHEAVHVLQKDQRRPGLVAVHDEAGRLVGAVVIDHAAELQPLFGRLFRMMLVGDDADREPAEPRVAADQRLAVLGLVLLKACRVDEAVEHVAHFVRIAEG